MDTPRQTRASAVRRAPGHARSHLLQPVLRAYLFGHLSTTAPRLLALLVALLSTRSRADARLVFDKLRPTLLSSLAPHRFPSFCALLVASYTFLRFPLRALTTGLSRRCSTAPSPLLPLRGARFLAAALAAWIALPLLNPPRRPAATALPRSDLDLVGKTMDLTLLASVRAIETMIHATSSSSSSPATNSLADPALFALSTSLIMWAWFYAPERLPRAYSSWITRAASVDPRLVDALRSARRGDWHYLQPTTPPDPVLQPMCKDHGLPEAWGDPSATSPFPCELVHMRRGPSCHRHALSRFGGGFAFAMRLYLPLYLLLRLPALARSPRPARALKAAVLDAVRSSAFLASFIALFYYSVCATRSWLVPNLVSSATACSANFRQAIDSGLCVAAACAACGWSVLIEKPRRRMELALFVAPRAAATVLPRRYERKYFWRERLSFAGGMGVLVMMAKEGKVRGVVGGLLERVLA